MSQSNRKMAQNRKRAMVVESLEVRRVFAALRDLPAFNASALARNDDGSSELVSLGFEVNFFGKSRDSLYVNNNGNVTFDAPLSDWTPDPIDNLKREIIAPFWADVDTRNLNSGVVTYGQGLVDGRNAFGVNWIDVGYFEENADKLNSFQLVMISRSDLAVGAFDLEFNYGEISWDTGDVAGENEPESNSARAGFSDGSQRSKASYELIGSGIESSFLDANQLTGLTTSRLNSTENGRFLFQYRAGSPLDEAGLAGQFVDLGNGIYFLGQSSVDFSADAINDSVDLSNADEAFAGGSLGVNLDGTGVTVLQWESGVPRTTHQELAGVITLGDPGASVTDHATQVAGTISAAGTLGGVVGSPVRRGFAPGVAITSFDVAGFEAEFTANIPNFDLSNRSNSNSRGWNGTANFAALAVLEPANPAGQLVDVWLGIRDSGIEDEGFGKYTDASRFLDTELATNTRHLSIWSAGNERGDSFGDVRNNNNYVATFAAAPAGALANLGSGQYYVSAVNFPVPDTDGTGALSGDGFDSISDQQTAKNVLAIGAIDDAPFLAAGGGLIERNDPGFRAALDASIAAFSSWGPVDDGRIKPELVANGVSLNMPVASDDDVDGLFDDFQNSSGTSFSAPSVTGVAALLQQQFDNLGTLSGTPRAATLKGLMIHTAIDGFNPGPDYQSGWGLVDAAGAVDFLNKESVPVEGETHFLAEPILNPGSAYTHAFKISGGPLRVTIAWTDPAATVDAAGVDTGLAAKLVNDLDLQVIGPNGTVLPWILDPANPTANATRGRNFRDNVEQVLIDAPVSGTYTLRVSHTGALQGNNPQAFSILASALLIDPDDCEPNDTIATACVLGSVNEVTLRDLSIHTNTDVDFFRYTAHETGKVVVNVRFLHALADVDLLIQDVNGNLLASSLSVDNDESVVFPVVSQQDYYIRVFATGGAIIEDYALEVENFAAPVPTLVDLTDLSDSGRKRDDDLTNDSTPTILVHVDLSNFLDPEADGVSFTALLNPAQFATHDAGAAVEIFLAGSSVGIATPVVGAENVFSFTLPVLLDGVQRITAAVRINDNAKKLVPAIDRAKRTGRADQSSPLLVTIDTAAPTAPTLALDPTATDTGIPSNPASYSDRVTRTTSPGLMGNAEASALVRFAADGNPISANVLNASDVLGGQTVAVPTDFTNSPGLIEGLFRHVLTLNLNDPALGFPVDGQRQIGATAEDLAGNVSQPAFLDILLDTTPGKVTAINFPNGASVFATKPQFAPSPSTTSLLVTFAGGPAAAAGLSTPAVDAGLATDARNYKLVGDHGGTILIPNVTLITSSPTEVTVRLNFSAPLPDDRFTLTLIDTISDASGNLLDGESQASSPGGTAVVLPSGNGIAGGNFQARFTVDSRPELGVVGQGLVYVDINGNADWDPTGADNDATNRDFVFQFGTVTDGHFAGNFAAAGAAGASGFDKLGVYGKVGPTYSFLIDTNDDGVGDFASTSAYQVNAIPVAGNFNAAHPGDEIGMFDGAFWYLDLNGNNTIDLGEKFPSDFTGIPLVGDFDGNGGDDLATYRNDTNTFYFDLNQNGTLDATWEVRDTVKRFGGLAGFTDRPIAGDLNLDGVDDIGLWTKGNGAALPENSGEVFFWVSDRVGVEPALGFNAYSPAPLGNDLFMQFGNENALPVFGNFDPPIEDVVIPPMTDNYLHRANKPLDVNGDNIVSPLDALVVINAINSRWETVVANPVRAAATFGTSKVDTSGDATLSAIDALLVINELNRVVASGEGEASLIAQPIAQQVGLSDSRTEVVDYFFSDLYAMLNPKKRR